MLDNMQSKVFVNLTLIPILQQMVRNSKCWKRCGTNRKFLVQKSDCYELLIVFLYDQFF